MVVPCERVVHYSQSATSNVVKKLCL